MKAVILAGGLGTRISEETESRPKPMVNIGGKPIIWHIMKMYSFHGINDFIICCGYKGYVIKEYFANYFLHTSDVTFDLSNNSQHVHRQTGEKWKVTLVDTGDTSMTGGRLLRVKDYLINEKEFCFTYGDGVGNNNIAESIKFHKEHGKLATMTTAYRPGRFGSILTEGNKISSFKEKPKGDGSMVNAGFFVLSPKVLDLLEDDQTVWEDEPLEKLSKMGELMAYEHDGYWQPMDTLFDKNTLESDWKEENPPWKLW